jgi:hypothetical protein
MPLFIVEIEGTNGSSANVYGARINLSSNGGAEFGQDGKVYVVPAYSVETGEPLVGSDPTSDPKVALFNDRAFAREVGLACRWNNQRYLVRPALGRVRQTGTLVTRETLGTFTGCQEGWRP